MSVPREDDIGTGGGSLEHFGKRRQVFSERIEDGNIVAQRAFGTRPCSNFPRDPLGECVHLYVRQPSLGGQSLKDVDGAVFGAVVDDDQLKVGCESIEAGDRVGKPACQ